MKRGKAMAFGLGALALLVAPHACNQFTELPATAEDASTDAPVATSSSSSGAVPPDVQSVPPWTPSFAADDVDAGAVLASIVPVCTALPDAGGPIAGNYDLTTLCVGTTTFGAAFAEYCRDLTFVPGHVLVRANAGILDNGDGTVLRTGNVRLAAEIDAPCRPQAGCSSLQTIVALALGGKGVDARCYDKPADTTSCICQVDATLELRDDNPLAYDTAAGTISNDYLYGKESSNLVYTGKTKGSFTIEPAFRWTLAPSP